MPKITLDEKRLQILRQQLSGKSVDASPRIVPQTIISTPTQVSTGASIVEDTSYLSQDLRKIFTLSAVAVALQGALFFSLQMKLVHLWF